MRAFTLDSFDSAPGLRDDRPEPRPGERELLVRVRASSVNPVDVAIAGGVLRDLIDHEFPVTLGRDFAGTVDAVGGAVDRFRVGDEVYGFVLHANPAVHDGSWTDVIVVPEERFVAAKPRHADFDGAGAAPLAGITALAALDALGPAPNETVLVVGASGGVGSFFVQLAAGAGAHVIAPAFADDEAYLRDLGVAELVDRDGDVLAAVHTQHPGGVDAILDLVSYEPQDTLLKQGGRLASPLGAAGDGPGRFALMAEPTPANLRRLAALVDDGTLRVPVERSFPLAEAGAAMQALAGSHVRGKLGIAF
jgi:NADPH:quinone reductase